MRFRKKPDEREIDAVQFSSEDEEADWPTGVFIHEGRHGIYTLAGFRHVNNNDWVITKPAGDLIVLTKEEFEKLYEVVE